MPAFVQVTFQHQSMLPEDEMVNTWAFDGGGPGTTDAQYTSLIGKLHNFYNLVPPGQPDAVGAFLSPCIDRGPFTTFKVWELDGHEDGSNMGDPKLELTGFGLPVADSATPLPSECSAVLTLTAVGIDFVNEEEEAGAPGPEGNVRPKSRHRNRKYIGPLNMSALDTGVLGQARISQNLISVTLAALGELRDDVAGTSFAIGVWSRADAVVRNAGGAWMDNAFDTQRRRGESRSYRSTVIL